MSARKRVGDVVVSCRFADVRLAELILLGWFKEGDDLPDVLDVDRYSKPGEIRLRVRRGAMIAEVAVQDDGGDRVISALCALMHALACRSGEVPQELRAGLVAL